MRPVLLTRRWIVLTVLVVAAVAAMVELGFWQLRRLDTVREDNVRVRERIALAVEPIGSVLRPGVDASSVTFRRVSATGRFDAANEIELANRSRDGSPGSHLLTPLVTDDGRALIVDRGWVPLRPTAAQRELARPPGGRVTLEGVLFPSERKGVFGPSIPPTGRLTTIPRVDVARISKQLPYPVYPLYLRFRPPGDGPELPVPPELPDLSEGSHLGYAIQWFAFAAIALVTFGALVRRNARRGRRPTERSVATEERMAILDDHGMDPSP